MRFRALVLFDIDGTLTRRTGPHHRDALVEGIRKVTGLRTTTDGIPLHGMLDPVILTRMMRRTWSANSVSVTTMRSGAASVVFDTTEPASIPIS